jgi:hypothetical protein
VQSNDQPRTQPASVRGDRSRRVRRTVLAVALGGGLALGVSSLAFADDSTGPSGAAPSGAAPSGPPAAAPDTARPKPRPHLDGTVKSISSGTITIVDPEGFTRQINIASAPNGVTVGTRIHAEGSVNADGVSLDATSVVVAPDRGPGRSGPRGPRPGMPKPPAPGESGAPAAPAPRQGGRAALRPRRPAAPRCRPGRVDPAPATEAGQPSGSDSGTKSVQGHVNSPFALRAVAVTPP